MQATGLLRTKPGRGARTSCMSCSDKLARWASIGLQGAVLSLLLREPVRLASIVVGQPCCVQSMHRALARASDVLLPRLAATHLPFEHCASAQASSVNELRPCSNSLVWAACGLAEVVNGLSGKRLGANKRAPSPKHRSSVCKALRARALHEILVTMPHTIWPTPLRWLYMEHKEEAAGQNDTGGSNGTATSLHIDASLLTYAELKRRAVIYQQRKAVLMALPKFSHWVKAPPGCESFTVFPTPHDRE